MKLRYLLASAAALGFALATHAQVYSVNIVGFQRVDISTNNYVLAATPFISETNTIQTILGNQLNATVDSVYIFDGQNYKKYAKDGSGTWRSATFPFAPPPDELPPGTGFLIQNNSATNQSVTVVGDVVDDPTVTVQIPVGFSVLSFPYSTDQDLNTSGLVSVANNGDEVYFYDPNTRNYAKYVFSTNGNVFRTVTFPFAPAVVDLTPGSSFFYRNVGASPLDWVETKPY